MSRWAKVVESYNGQVPLGNGMREFWDRMSDEFRPVRHTDIARYADVCRNCVEPGHWERDCPSIKCNGCGELGHIRRNCPKATQ